MRFTCGCGHEVPVPAGQTAGLVRCPYCGGASELVRKAGGGVAVRPAGGHRRQPGAPGLRGECDGLHSNIGTTG